MRSRRTIRTAYSESEPNDCDAIAWVGCLVVHTSKLCVKKGFGEGAPEVKSLQEERTGIASLEEESEKMR